MKLIRVSLLSLFFPIYLFAQSGTETQGSTLLPDINPQDIEIKGDYRIRFPGLQRQPILGFDPRQRVFQLDPNRIPFLETNDEVVASIPISPLEIPNSPVRTFAKKPESSNWWLLGGYGLRQSPEAELGFAFYKPSNYRITGLFSHLSSPDLGFDVPSSFAETRGKLSYTEMISKGFQWNLTVNGVLENHQNPLNQTTTTKAEIAQLGAKTELRKVVNSWNYWTLKGSYSLFDHTVLTRATNQQEHKASFYYDSFWTLDTPRTGFGIGLDIQALNYKVLSATENVALIQFFASYKNDNSSELKYNLGVSPYYYQDAGKTGFLVYPKADLTWYGFLGATLRAGIFGEVNAVGRQQFYETNRFVNTDQTVFTNRGLALYMNYEKELMSRSSLYAGFDLKRFTQFGFLNYAPDANIAGEFNHIIQYDEAQIVKIKGGYSFRFDAPDLSFNAEGWILNHQLSNGNQIPYMERFGVKTSLLWFIQKNWYIQPEIEFLAGREGINSTPTLFLVHAKTRYAFNKNWAIYLKALNLTGSSYTYWSDFKEWPLFLTGGLNLTF